MERTEAVLGTKFPWNSLTGTQRGTVDSILPGVVTSAMKIGAVDEKKIIQKQHGLNKLAVQARKLL